MMRRFAAGRRAFARGGGRIVLYVLVAVAAAAVVAWWPPSPSPQEKESAAWDEQITLYAFSAMDDVLTDGLLPAFQGHWAEKTGTRVGFETVFGGSRSLAEQIELGHQNRDDSRAQIAILASEIDALALAPDVVQPDAWRGLPHRGVLARIPVVLHVREGNPGAIREMRDLTTSGADVVRADPQISGLGVAVLLATYGAELRSSGSHRDAMAEALLLQVAPRIPAGSARVAANCFRRGVGDVCPVYAHDAVGTPSRSAPAGEVVRPPSTFVCEPVAVVIRRNVTAGQQSVVDGFLEFLWSSRGRAILAQYGLGAPDADAAALGIRDGFTLDDLGGPERVRRAILEPLLRVRGSQ